MLGLIIVLRIIRRIRHIERITLTSIITNYWWNYVFARRRESLTIGILLT